ncbi:Major facilitator superfamily (MFS) profile domain-containing protein [Entamoeba marina]
MLIASKLIKNNIQKFYCLNGLLFDFSVYFYWLIIPVLLKELGASPFVIGMSNALSFGIGGLLAPITGMITDKWRGEILCRFGSILQSSTCILTGLFYVSSESLIPLVILLIIQGVGISLFWSPADTLVVKCSYKGQENKNIGEFETFCCIGKAIGFLFGGTISIFIGDTYSLYFSAVFSLLIFILFPLQPEYLNEEVDPKQNQNTKVVEKRNPVLFYITALVIYFFCDGIVSIISNQYIGFADDEGIILEGISDKSSVFVGIFLFIENIFQMIGFVTLSRWSGWQYHMRYNVIAPIIFLIVTCLMRFLTNGYVILILAVPLGLCAGYEYQAALYYSVNISESHGKYLGITEFIAEVTYCLSPVISGIFFFIFWKEYCHYVSMAMSLLCTLYVIPISIADRFHKSTRIELYNSLSENEDIGYSRDSSLDYSDSERLGNSIDCTESQRIDLLTGVIEKGLTPIRYSKSVDSLIEMQILSNKTTEKTIQTSN